MGPQRIPILVYHHVYHDYEPELREANDGAGIIGEQAFRNQMEHLRDHGCTVVSTTQVADWLDNTVELPKRTAALHFDNGWLDTMEVVYPILQEFGVTATCFPITDGIEAASAGSTAVVRTLTEGVVDKPFMTWEQLQQLVASGWEIGGHTATHCKVADKFESEGEAGILEEVQVSNELLQEKLGFKPTHFAYPSGSRTDATDRLLAQHYRTLRLWHVESPIQWSFTDRHTSPLAIDCQNIDLSVPFQDFVRLFDEAETDDDDRATQS